MRYFYSIVFKNLSIHLDRRLTLTKKDVQANGKTIKTIIGKQSAVVKKRYACDQYGPTE